MRVFITGGSGYIGNAVARCFRREGHDVSGLVRSERAAKELALQEIRPVIGDMSEPSSFASAAEVDLLIHCGSDSSKEGEQKNLQALQNVLASAVKGHPKMLIYTSGCWVHGNTGGEWVDETTPPNPLSFVTWRPLHEKRVLEAASATLKTAVVRPGIVYGAGGGLADLWFAAAAKDSLEMIEGGSSHLAMVHRDDLARAYRLIAHQETCRGIYGINDGSTLQVKTIVQAIAEKMGLSNQQIRTISYEEAQKKLGDLAEGLTADQCIRNERAQTILGWRPFHLNFLCSIDRYLDAWRALNGSSSKA